MNNKTTEGSEMAEAPRKREKLTGENRAAWMESRMDYFERSLDRIEKSIDGIADNLKTLTRLEEQHLSARSVQERFERDLSAAAGRVSTIEKLVQAHDDRLKVHAFWARFIGVTVGSLVLVALGKLILIQ